ncbi:MAG: hypothetical protein COB96_01115 [Planctomycetota bacterium]|nr:MAG: hypothetical protein COB96_01115 [Planctomycetota bacterium]
MDSTAPVILATGLELKFGSTPILRGVDLSVNPGDLYGLLGRNGAGKTTTMRALLGFLPQFSGHAEIFGVSARKLHLLPQQLGVALDPPGLDDSLSVRQNLELACLRGGIDFGRGVDEVLALVGLTERQHNRSDKLSHGQGRRAAVARALLGDPQLLLLDEPLSGLDPEGVELLLELFRRLSFDEGVTVVLSSHHLREVQDVCNRVGMIEQGRCILEGDTRDLIAAAGDTLDIHCADSQRALELLSTNPLVRKAEETGSGRLHARLHEDVDLVALCASMAAADIGLDQFNPCHASLMDVFFEAVGEAS